MNFSQLEDYILKNENRRKIIPKTIFKHYKGSEDYYTQHLIRKLFYYKK